MIEHIIKNIREADMVLIGLGEELDAINEVRISQDYKNITQKIADPCIIPYIEKVKLEEVKPNILPVYKSLAGWLNQKNYFVITTSQDGIIRECGLKEDRIVEPCGGYAKLQCSEKCSTDLYDIPESFRHDIRKFIDDRAKEEDLKFPACPVCGSRLVFNNINAEKYLEEGYLSKWQIYKKWLQGTVNKKLCLLEIGVGMKYPTVIRWPFEKIAFYNQKAELFRVHSRLYQITEEIKDKGYGICQKPEEFLKELSKGF